ncbi:Nse4 C-terminal-domain-containing protein [Exophiala viscosa]|uniref:Nse4 C-terminal-domain-containing protein n=1 Tax=Exophiala viscosa TaxID=2486360 RepID=UPI002195C5FD|nr:Nse4 C-terminal-domain-containing protein [Exophiala viscosa]
MARLNTQAASPDSESQGLSSSPNRDTPRTSDPPSSPAQPSDSDKENHTRSSTSGRGKRVRNTALMPESRGAESSHAQKRRRISAEEPQSTARTHKFYDPDQDPEERRLVRKGLRSLFAELHDSKTEFLKPESKGLEDTLRKADELFKNVKQTSEATIDSRLLVEAADLSFRKINNLALGDGSTGIDVDDFVTKCIGFMKRGDEPEQRNHNEPPSTQTQRRRRRQGEDLEDGDEGDTMNWEYLGKNACFLYNARPCLTGFLLGPLSVQKKVRQQTQRKAREARTQDTQALRPVELNDEDLEKQESASLTVICTEIARLLETAISRGEKVVEKEFEEAGDDISDEEAGEILRRHSMADNGCLPLFNFCVNPKSFGQTVENMFYVSFLIKEGKVGLDFDSHGLPTLGIAATRTMAERQETKRNQAVFTLDYDVWEDIVKSFGITKSIIPHRSEENYDDGIIDYARGEDNAAREVEEDEESDAYA